MDKLFIQYCKENGHREEDVIFKYQEKKIDGFATLRYGVRSLKLPKYGKLDAEERSTLHMYKRESKRGGIH